MPNHFKSFDPCNGGSLAGKQSATPECESTFAGRASVWVVVAFLILLQAFGPFLHAHARGATGLATGLHLHLNAGNLSSLSASRVAGSMKLEDGVANIHIRGEVLLSGLDWTPDEGAAILLSDEYRSRRDAASSGQLPFASLESDHFPMVVCAPMFPTRSSVAEVARSRSHRLPPSNAPPTV